MLISIISIEANFVSVPFIIYLFESMHAIKRQMMSNTKKDNFHHIFLLLANIVVPMLI
jgi:hypothetical protein